MTRVGEKVAWMGCDGIAGVAPAAPEGEREKRGGGWGWGTVKVLTLDKPSPRRSPRQGHGRGLHPRDSTSSRRLTGTVERLSERYGIAGVWLPRRGWGKGWEREREGGRVERARRAFKFSPPCGGRGQRSPEKCSVKVVLSTREYRASFLAKSLILDYLSLC